VEAETRRGSRGAALATGTLGSPSPLLFPVGLNEVDCATFLQLLGYMGNSGTGICYPNYPN
jgi:hypothetical protein